MGINEAIVIGLGSMGKRRIRCLLALDIKKIIGVDVREDRRLEVEEKYGIMVCKSYDEYLLDNKPSIAIISLPPRSLSFNALNSLPKPLLPRGEGLNTYMPASL